MKEKFDDNPQFFIVDYRVLKDNRLCPFDVVCYSAICGLANNKFNYCFATNQKLADILNCSTRNIQRALAVLKQTGYITIEIKNFNTRQIKTSLNLAIDLTNKKMEALQNRDKIEIIDYDWLNENEVAYE